jgi:hypothetical protein
MGGRGFLLTAGCGWQGGGSPPHSKMVRQAVGWYVVLGGVASAPPDCGDWTFYGALQDILYTPR